MIDHMIYSSAVTHLLPTMYRIARGSVPIDSGQFTISSPVWANDEWSRARRAELTHFHPRSSSHRPTTAALLLHDAESLYLRFDVWDRFVVARATGNQQSVCQDSCVEMFIRPRRDGGYFNFEFNCGGTMLASFIEDWRRVPDDFAKYEMLSESQLSAIAVAHTMPRIVDPEIEEPVAWSLCCRIPLTIFSDYVGTIDTGLGAQWTGNFYKCADRCSHPHWASWGAMGEALNFHEPAGFLPFSFE